MRRLAVTALGAVLALGAAAAPPAQARAHALARTAPVSQTVRVQHLHLDLTDGPALEQVVVTASSTRRLRLVGIQLDARDASGATQIGSVPNAIYPVDPRWTTKLSGDRDSGVWRVRLPVRRWTRAGDYDLSVSWKVGRMGPHVIDTGKHVVIVNPHGDESAPVLTSLDRPAEGATVSRRRPPVVSFHAKDRGSGLGLAYVCYLSKAALSQAATCDEVRLTDGTRHDGVYSGRLENLPYADAPNGPAVFWIQLNDYAGWYSSWVAADVGQDGFGSPIPDGRGDFTLVP
jgi:hypothetical protein